MVEEAGDGTVQTRAERRDSTTGCWEPGGVRRRLVNTGTTPYRELRVELK